MIIQHYIKVTLWTSGQDGGVGRSWTHLFPQHTKTTNTVDPGTTEGLGAWTREQEGLGAQ